MKGTQDLAGQCKRDAVFLYRNQIHPVDTCRTFLLKIHFIIIHPRMHQIPKLLHRTGWRSGNALDLYSEGSPLKFQPGHRIS